MTDTIKSKISENENKDSHETFSFVHCSLFVFNNTEISSVTENELHHEKSFLSNCLHVFRKFANK